MRNIHCFTIIPTTVDKEGSISNYLLHAHYPHFIDTEKDCIVVLNIPEVEIQRIMSLFEMSSWDYHGYGEVFETYSSVFRYVNDKIEKNLSDYWNFIRIRGEKKPNDHLMEEFIRGVYSDSDYHSWRRRFYLSRGAMGFDSQTTRKIGYNVTEPIIWRLREEIKPIRARIEIPEYSTDNDNRINTDFSIDILYEPERLYCGIFCNRPNLMTNSHFVRCLKHLRKEFPNSFSGLTNFRQIIGKENIEKFLTKYGILRGEFADLLPEWGWRR